MLLLHTDPQKVETLCPTPFLFHQDNTSWPTTLLGTELISPEKKLGKLPGSPFRLYILEGHKACPEADFCCSCAADEEAEAQN